VQGFISLCNAYSIATVVVYLAILVTVKVRLVLVQNTYGNVQIVKSEMETKVLATVGFIVTFYAITFLGTGIAAFILSQQPLATAQMAIGYIPLFVVLNGSINVLIYLWKNEVVREEFVYVFCSKIPQTTGTGNLAVVGVNPNRRLAWIET